MHLATIHDDEEETPALAPDKRLRPGVHKVTLAQLGPTLPIGTIDFTTNALTKTLTFGRWTLKVEKELGKFRDENRGSNMGTLTSALLGRLCESVGSVTLNGASATASDKKAMRTAAAKVSQLYLADVLYALTYLRTQVIGNVYRVEVACPRCRNTQDFDADLTSLEVYTVDSLEATQWVHTLLDPLIIRGKEVSALTMGAPRWRTVEAAGGANTGEAKILMVYNSILGAPALENAAITENELEDLSKRDLEHLIGACDLYHLGPDMLLEVDCKKCQAHFKQPIDWTYDNFFGASGR